VCWLLCLSGGDDREASLFLSVLFPVISSAMSAFSGVSLSPVRHVIYRCRLPGMRHKMFSVSVFSRFAVEMLRI
jgi:hypothetical protein